MTTRMRRRKGGGAKDAKVYVRIMNHRGGPRTAVAPTVSTVLARRVHYAEFFGLAAFPEHYGVVLGNCQAESLRMVIDAPEHRFIRVPPVHEMSGAEVERLHEVVAAADIVVSQPIRDD